MATTVNTKKPTGLSIARDGWKYTLSWKIADADYGAGQAMQYRLSTKPKQWVSVSINSTRTSKTVTLTASSFYPTTKKKLAWVEFRLCGRRSNFTKNSVSYTCNKSEWSVKRMSLNVPSKPALSATLGNLSNVCTFDWTTATTTKDARPFIRVEYQSILVNSAEKTGSKLSWKSSTTGWRTGTGSASGSVTITEDSTTLASGAYARWVRVRSVGPAGVSDWRYSKHVYSTPRAAVIQSVKTNLDGTTTIVRVKWTAQQDGLHPIDRTEMEYYIGTPASGFACPAGASWTSISSTADTGGTDAARASISDAVGLDQCLWVRVRTFHDSNYAASDAVLARVGRLTDPSGLTATPDSTTYQVAVSVTNNSDVPDAFLAVIFVTADRASQPVVVGVIPAGSSAATVQCPDWSDVDEIKIGVQAIQGTYTAKAIDGGVTSYAIESNMESSIVYSGSGSIPTAAGNVSVSASEMTGEAILEWDWSWSAATGAEISWSTNPHAWESTSEPSTYIVTRLHSPLWRVSELEVGQRYYFRIRLFQEVEGEYTFAPYSETVSLDLSSAPDVPVVELSRAVITDGGTFTVSWTYTSADGTQQAYAEVADFFLGLPATILRKVETDHSVDINVTEAGWSTGERHYIGVRVVSASGLASGWSDTTVVSTADPVSCSISTTSLESVTLTDADSETRTVLSLTALPLSVTVTGAADDDTTTVAIERTEDYEMDRPDESTFTGFAGETIALIRQQGASAISIDLDDLEGHFDDGAQYRIVATVNDALGQSASSEMDFEVHWDHQAIVPAGTVSIDQSKLIALITPTAPSGYTAGDTFDIYRLSADAPQLIYPDAEAGTVYVDPYPAIGDHGGYRIVYKTIYGDYITTDNEIAWLDIPAGLTEHNAIIDFGDGQVSLAYNIELSSSWDKDFKRTAYLGGAVQGDWNPAIERSGSIGTTVATDDLEIINAMRRLSVYPGICHVRTPDGSSFAADVQVSESRSYDNAGKLAVFTIKTTKVDSEAFDGMTYAEWLEAQ